MANKEKLDVICARCGSEKIYGHLNSKRALIRCASCGRRIFAYYNRSDSAHGEHSPVPPSADLPDLTGYTNVTRTLYEFLWRYINEHGFAPTQREIQRGLGWASISSVRHHLDILEAGGLIEKEYATARGIRLK